MFPKIFLPLAEQRGGALPACGFAWVGPALCNALTTGAMVRAILAAVCRPTVGANIKRVTAAEAETE